MRTIVFIVALTLLISSCENKKREEFQKIELGDSCLENLKLSFFHGVHPDIEVSKVYNILGKPDEEFVINDIDEPRIDLAYYNDQGRILLHWSGEQIDVIGMIEFRPKNKLYLKNVVQKNLRIHKRILRLDCNEKYKMFIYLNDNSDTIRKIEWWFQ